MRKKFFLFFLKKLKKNVIISSNVDFWKSEFKGYNSLGKGTEFSYSNLGRMSYIGKNCILNKAQIKNYCSIGNDVKIIYGKHPTNLFFSTHPSFYSTKKQCGFSYVNKDLFVENNVLESNYSILIENDVWIGSQTSILEGVKIGNGAIVATGSVVTKDVSPYEIVGGVPAKNIGYRFNEDIINNLLESRWWDMSNEELNTEKIIELNKIVGNRNYEENY